MLFEIRDLLDETRCYDVIRELRWPEGRRCPHCDSKRVIRKGFDEVHTARQRYQCQDCTRRFDDLTGTIFANHRQPVKVWVMALYLMGLNLSNAQVAKELGLSPKDAQRMCEQLREGIVEKKQSPA